jgi:hypothetical protein
MLLTEEFNGHENVFKGIYTYPKQLFIKDLRVRMKTMVCYWRKNLIETKNVLVENTITRKNFIPKI